MTGAPPSRAELARRIDAVGSLLESFIAALAVDVEQYGRVDYPSYVRHCAETLCTALYTPRVIAEAEQITREAADDEYGRTLRALQARSLR